MAIAVATLEPSPTMPNFIADYFSAPVPRHYSTKENFWTYISLSRISLGHLGQNLNIIFTSPELLKKELYSQRMRAAALFLRDYVLPSAPAMADDGIPVPPRDMLEDIQSVAAKYGHEFALPVSYRSCSAGHISLSSCVPQARKRTDSEIALSSSMDSLASSSLEFDNFELSRSYQALFGERAPEDIPIRWALGSVMHDNDGDDREEDLMRGAMWDWRRHGRWGKEGEDDGEVREGMGCKGKEEGLADGIADGIVSLSPSDSGEVVEARDIGADGGGDGGDGGAVEGKANV